jgi:hypothetical protein
VGCGRFAGGGQERGRAYVGGEQQSSVDPGTITDSDGVGASLDGSPDVVQYGPNTGQNGGAGPTRNQHELTRRPIPLNLQNLHPRFKSGRRLHFSLGKSTICVPGRANARPPIGRRWTTKSSLRRAAAAVNRSPAAGCADANREGGRSGEPLPRTAREGERARHHAPHLRQRSRTSSGSAFAHAHVALSALRRDKD